MFFFFVKLCNRVFQQAGAFYETSLRRDHSLRLGQHTACKPLSTPASVTESMWPRFIDIGENLLMEGGVS